MAWKCKILMDTENKGISTVESKYVNVDPITNEIKDLFVYSRRVTIGTLDADSFVSECKLRLKNFFDKKIEVEAFEKSLEDKLNG